MPVYLTAEDIRYYSRSGFTLGLRDLLQRIPLTGHIDLLQIRNNRIHILDYKPEAEKQQPLHQLTAYALALASRTRLPLKDFTCAWFDDRHYYEFFPLQAVYALRERVTACLWNRAGEFETQFQNRLGRSPTGTIPADKPDYFV